MDNRKFYVIRFSLKDGPSIMPEVYDAYEEVARIIGDADSVIGLPDYMSLQQLSYDDLVDIQHDITDILNKIRYKPTCHYEDSDPKPCEVKPLDCEDCDEYYSDDDERW